MATVEAPAAAGDRSKLALLRRTLQERQQELVKARRTVAELLEKEKGLVAASVREAPTRRVFSMGTPAQRSRARREKVKDTIPTLELEIAELVNAVEEAEAAEYTAVLDEARLEAGRLRKQELAAWEKAGEALRAMHECWCAIVDPAEELDRLVSAIRASEAGQRCEDTEAVRAFVDASRPPVDPFPHDFTGFLTWMSEIASGYCERNDVRSDQDGRLAGGLIPRFTPRTPSLRADRVNRA